MRSLIVVSLVFFAGTMSNAQGVPNTGPGAYTDSLALHNIDLISQSYDQLPAHADTPEQRDARLAKAVALRSKAIELAAADGGTMNTKHLAYVRAKAKAIMAN